MTHFDEKHTLDYKKQDAVSAIIKSLDKYPELWSWDESRYTIDHKNNDISIWISSSGYSPYLYKPYKVLFGFWDRHRLRKACKRWIKKQGRRITREATMKACQHVIDELR